MASRSMSSSSSRSGRADAVAAPSAGGEGAAAALLALDPAEVARAAVADAATLERVEAFAEDLTRKVAGEKRTRDEARGRKAEEKRRERARLKKLKGVCQGCGRAAGKLTSCQCVGSWGSNYDGGIVLCDGCVEKGELVKKCEFCMKLLCNEDCKEADKCWICGRHPEFDVEYSKDFPDNPDYQEDVCGRVVCWGDCFEKAGWDSCRCGAMAFSPKCGECRIRSASYICPQCNTPFCNDEKGDCWLQCKRCDKDICPKCLGLDACARQGLCNKCQKNANGIRLEESDSDERYDY